MPDEEKIILPIDTNLSGFSKNNEKIGMETVLNETWKHFKNFGAVVSKGNYAELSNLLRSGDPVAISIIVWTILVAIGLTYYIFSSPPDKKNEDASEQQDEKPPLRDFTVEQLREYDGKIEGKQILIGLKGDVFDVTESADMYGSKGSYNCFAGRDATRALALLSFEESDLSNPNISDFTAFDRDNLQNWVEKFKYHRAYPIVGKLSYPPKQLSFSKKELEKLNGLQEVPDGRIDAPIYMGVNGKIFDVSYGGKEMYGPGGPYHIFAGRDASKALAKMSFDKEDLASSDLSDLTEAQRKTLLDWETKFVNSKKYPIVGTLHA